MTTYNFTPSMSFTQARAQMDALNQAAHKHLVAKLVWQEGNQAGQEEEYLWDGLAERFGHQIEKESIDVEIISSLVNGIPLQVHLVEIHPLPHHKK